MQTKQECGCEYAPQCSGYISATEVRMNKLDPSRSVREYHEIMMLFETAFDTDPDNL